MDFGYHYAQFATETPSQAQSGLWRAQRGQHHDQLPACLGRSVVERLLLHVRRGGESLLTGGQQRGAAGLRPPAAADTRKERDAEGNPVCPGVAAQTAAASVPRKVQLRSAFHAGLVQNFIK